MAIDLLSYSLSNRSFKIRSFNLGEVSTLGWAIVNVKIRLQAKIFKNQREDGSYIVDGRVKMPRILTVTVIAQTKSASDAITKMLQNRSTIYTINSRGLIFERMVLQNNNFSQDADNITSQPIQLVFHEILTQQDVSIQTAQAADSTVIERGIAYIKETTASVTGVATKVMNGIKGMF
ncbi:hypothetical protein WFH_00038 [Escherichia phage vB_EcoM_WFH]|uniref:Uncharacterized protein n=1 Tax=Escherichia phage vB_EcoM_WFH TaxID=2508192 RepID=A0A482MUS4_9CAUD|nr:tail fiber protein [Escherichia phage vB_EcoM_WFH]QBQ77326.1 hypothetical protein WFH_00038 [Escherichia phage vB_EcoM_WFH]